MGLGYDTVIQVVSIVDHCQANVVHPETHLPVALGVYNVQLLDKNVPPPSPPSLPPSFFSLFPMHTPTPLSNT